PSNSLFCSIIRPTPKITPFPYTTLFRSRGGRERAKKKSNLEYACLHFKFSINPRTSRRFSGEIVVPPLCAPLYCHSSLCSNRRRDRKSTRLNSSHVSISYAVFCLKKKNR